MQHGEHTNPWRHSKAERYRPRLMPNFVASSQASCVRYFVAAPRPAHPDKRYDDLKASLALLLGGTLVGSLAACSVPPSTNSERPAVTDGGGQGGTTEEADTQRAGDSAGGAAGDSASPIAAAGALSVEAGGAGGAAQIACADEVRAVPYEAGLELASELGMRVTLVESRPAPHVGDHAWTLQVVDVDGQPVVGASVKVSPFMPDHHHGSPLIAVAKERDDGLYVAEPVELIMPGYWRTTVRVTTEAWTDSVPIPLCIE